MSDLLSALSQYLLVFLVGKVFLVGISFELDSIAGEWLQCRGFGIIQIEILGREGRKEITTVNVVTAGWTDSD